MSDPNQKPTDVNRQAEDAHRTADNVEIKHEKSEESTLVKQEPLEGDRTETCDNVYDSLFDVIKHEIRSESPEIDHQRDCNVDTPATITDFSFEDVSPGNMKTYIKSEPSEAEVSLPADFILALDMSLVKEHTTTESDSEKEEEASSVKQNDFKTRTQQTLNKDKHTDNREMNREDAEGGSVARRGDTHTGTQLAKEHTTTENSEIDEASSVKQNCFKPRTQQTLHYKDKDTDNREMNKANSHTSETIFPCHHCSYKTRYKCNLMRHVRAHTGEKRHSCEYCDYKCSQASQLKSHMKTHTGEKPHSCEYCNYKCSEVSNLKSHMRTHTGEKPNSCEYCNYKCARVSDLKRHMRTHTGEKPHSCEYCNYKCSQVSDLKRHMRTHTGEKHHSCEYCNYKCSRVSDLKFHIRTHWGETLFL